MKEKIFPEKLLNNVLFKQFIDNFRALLLLKLNSLVVLIVVDFFSDFHLVVKYTILSLINFPFRNP